MKTPISSPLRSQRGSVLVVALMLSAAIAVSLAGYLSLSRTNMKISNRALYNNAAMNLAENGLEEAMYSINKKVLDPTYNWSGWSISGITATRTMTGYTFDGLATGQTKVVVTGYDGSSDPVLVARSAITLSAGQGQGQDVEKWVKVTLVRTSRYANSMLARESITFSGNNTVNSWNSEKNLDGTARTAPVAYIDAYKDDNAIVASVYTGVVNVFTNNADIFGYVKVGYTDNPSITTDDINVRNNGLIGVYGPPQTANGTIEPGRASYDFKMDMAPVSTITTGTSIAAIVSADLPTSLGTDGSTTIYRVPSISSEGDIGKILTINGDVTIVVTAAYGTDAIKLAGNTSIKISNGSSLKIYAEGNIKITGNGVTNGNTQPSSCFIYNTYVPSDPNSFVPPEVDVRGNGTLRAVVDAPNAKVTIAGNGNIDGAVIGKTIVVSGSNAAFHYDESLANITGGNPFRISKWEELTTNSSRDTYRTALRFDSPGALLF